MVHSMSLCSRCYRPLVVLSIVGFGYLIEHAWIFDEWSFFYRIMEIILIVWECGTDEEFTWRFDALI